MPDSGTIRAGAAASIWNTAAADAGLVRELAGALGLSWPLATALVNRRIESVQAAERFLTPRLSDLGDPFLLPDMDRAVERLWRAVERGESIAVFGDYDVDGVSSTALMVHFLSGLGAVATPFLPRRVEDGYGLTLSATQRCVGELRPSLILTVDCGTGSAEAVAWAAQQGVDVLITDHHEASGPVAEALAVVNPKRGGPEALRMLAGVGVAFKLCHAMLKRGRAESRPQAHLDLRELLDFVALGTVSDIVPLQGENRILTHHGLQRINEQARPGLRSLIQVAGIEGPIQAHHIGFQLGPRLNAAGRLGSAEPALQLLLAEEAGQTLRLAQHLDAENRRRQDLENRTLAEAVAWIESSLDLDVARGVVIGHDNWHPGVNGIVASRLVELYRRPAIVVGFDESGMGRGSCRSISGFDLVGNLEACAAHLNQFGGHAMAAGLVVPRDSFADFQKAFLDLAAAVLANADLRPVLTIDAWLDLGSADRRLYETTQRLRPFGPANPQPVWACRDVRVVGRPRVVGKNHLKLCLASGGRQVDAIGFGLGARAIPDGPLDVAFQLRLDDYFGEESLQLNLLDFRAAETS